MEKLTIKEAGRYANFLNMSLMKLSNLAYSGLDSKLIKRVEKHKKSEAYKQAEDEIIEVEFEDIVDVELETLTDIINDLVIEKIALADAIANAKKDISINVEDNKYIGLDPAIEYAKALRKMSTNFYLPLITRKDEKEKTTQRAYAFNVEGNQTPYFYEAEIETTLRYDKDKYVEKNKKVKMLADKISEEIDRAMSSDIVEFKPKYNYLDRIEDIIDKYQME